MVCDVVISASAARHKTSPPPIGRMHSLRLVNQPTKSGRTLGMVISAIPTNPWRILAVERRGCESCLLADQTYPETLPQAGRL